MVVDKFQHEKKIAVDLEADSMFHFREKVCLIQMADRKRNFVLDPLRIGDLSILKPVFANRNITKVFHGADYDVRSLYRDFHIKINNLFDTQLASMYLGLKETSLEAVIQKRFNVTLNKKYQRKDWSQRPLPEKMVAYAASDVAYLVPLAETLEQELAEKKRLKWVREECAKLSKVRPPQANHEPLYLSFKGAGRLGGKSLAVLEALLQFRKQIAEKKDRPLFKIFQNNTLMRLAVEKPKNVKRMSQTRIISAKQINMYGKPLSTLINDALNIPKEKLPEFPRKKAPAIDPAVPDRIKILKKWRDRKAAKMKIDPSLLFSKALLYAIAQENPSDMTGMKGIRELKKWQINEFGDEILDELK